jgi:DNA-binding response OmpR family regulator
LCDVLVVEDQAVVRMVLVDMLEDEGLKVKEAASPDEAYSAAQEPSGGAVLLTAIDLGVPDTDGFAVADQVRRILPGVQVLYVSGRPWLLSKRTRSLGERVLAKPFSKAQLLHEVILLLNRRHAQPD